MKVKKLKKKLRSKRGLTLLEILIGITIVVIVFASTLGAMVNGFTTTVYNADENRAAILNSSVNEIIMNTVQKMNISQPERADDVIQDIQSGDPTHSVILAAVTAAVPEARFVPATTDPSGNPTVNFPNDVSYQYSLIPDVKLSMESPTGGTDIIGIQIKTCFESAAGPIIYESFVPYAK